MDIIKQMEWRYAVKKFDPEKTLSPEQLNKLKEAFNLTATSYGLQPIKLVVLKNRKVQEQLVAHSYQQLQVAQASHVLVLCIEKAIDDTYIVDYFERVRQVRGTSQAILDPFKKDLVKTFSKKSMAEIKQWATNQAYLAMGNLLTVCAAEQIDACPMEGFVPSAYDEVLGLASQGLTSVLVLPVGYRAGDDMFSDLKKVRRPLTESIIEIS
ncbi:nitroreductase family protein [Spongiimicrobium sp. 2-473A-2-J]|uniref:nitroreductase family protein n=1 Tax=Eudoraea algarum TaxID=3417568 RepID=UPI003D36B2BA